jgi:FkbM family methyltransferase
MSQNNCRQGAVLTKIKGNLRGTLRHLGLEILRWRPQSSPEAALAKMLSQHRIDTVLDVGANEGQYALSLRELGFNGRIISFEPLGMAHQRLQRSAVKDPSWIIPPRTAIGNQEGEIELNLASNGASSSVLPMLEAHRRAAPAVGYIGTEIVPISRLDRVAREFLGDARSIFLKVDAQGFELQVLQGAADLIRRIAGAQLELSLVPLYEGQALFSELVDWMITEGFSIWGILPGLTDSSSGRLLQTDVVFFRT